MTIRGLPVDQVKTLPYYGRNFPFIPWTLRSKLHVSFVFARNLFGQLRLTVASLTIEQIKQDRESFLDSIRKNVAPELNKIGLYLIKVNITDITGDNELVKSCNGDAKSAATLLMIEKIEELVTLQVEAIRNLKIDKITVWDSGNGDKAGNTTANFLSGLIKSLPPLHDIAELSGLELPKYLGEVQSEKKEVNNQASTESRTEKDPKES